MMVVNVNVLRICIMIENSFFLSNQTQVLLGIRLEVELSSVVFQVTLKVTTHY